MKVNGTSQSLEPRRVGMASNASASRCGRARHPGAEPPAPVPAYGLGPSGENGAGPVRADSSTVEVQCSSECARPTRTQPIHEDRAVAARRRQCRFTRMR